MAFEVIFTRFSPFNRCARLDEEKTSVEIFPWKKINKFWTADSFSFFFSSKQQRVRSQFLFYFYFFDEFNYFVLLEWNQSSTRVHGFKSGHRASWYYFDEGMIFPPFYLLKNFISSPKFYIFFFMKGNFGHYILAMNDYNYFGTLYWLQLLVFLFWV